MPLYYLLRAEGLYSDAADYPEKPAYRPDGVWVEGSPNGLNQFLQTEPPTLNARLEAAMLTMLPNHLNQPYMTDKIIADVMQAKVAVIDANKIDTTGTLTRAIIRAIGLPEAMEADRQNILLMLELFQNANP